MKMKGDRIHFVDTNVLLSACVENRENHRVCLQLLEEGLRGKWSLYASGQILREFLVVATRPLSGNGLGMNPDEALSNVEEFSRCIRLLGETEAVSRRLRKLVMDYDLRGKRIHDANVVATMQEHGVSRLVTDNGADFRMFPDIHTIPAADCV